MKQSRLCTPVLVSFTAIVLAVVSYSSASVTSWDDFNSSANDYYNSVYHRGNNSTAPMLNPDEFNIYKILRKTDTAELLWNPDKTNRQNLFDDVLISETSYTMPDELVTLQIISRPLIPDRSSELNSNMQPTSEPAYDTVFTNDADYIKSMRTPAPTSLLLVAIGLLSLRFTRRLRY